MRLPADISLTGVLRHVLALQWLPVLANVVLVAWVALLFSELLWPFIVDGNDVPPAPEYITAIDAGQAADKNTITGRQIAAWHLFGKAGAPAAKTNPVPANAPDTKLVLTLRGIYAADDKHLGLAIIQNPKKEEKYFAYRDSVFGLATLEEIYVDRVILLRNGRYETLRLPEERLAFQAKVSSNKGIRKQMSSEEYVNSMRGEMKKIHKMTLREMKNPWQYLYFEPEIINGSMTGLKLTAEEESEFLARQGLEVGDIITSVNGIQIDGGGGVAKAMNELSDRDDDDRLELIIMRKGRSKTIIINNDRPAAGGNH